MDMLSQFDSAQDFNFLTAENVERWRFAGLWVEPDGVRIGQPSNGRFVAGIFQGRREQNNWCPIRCTGLSRLEVSEAVKPGDYICAGADGRGRLALPGELARAVCLVPASESEMAVVLICFKQV